MLRALISGLLIAGLAAPAGAQRGIPVTEDEKVAYQMGLFVAQRMNLISLGMTQAELDSMARGMSDAAIDRLPAVTLADPIQRVREFEERRREQVHEKELKASVAFLEEMARRPETKRGEAGMVYQVLAQGDGARPTLDDRIRVHYSGSLRDGRTFDTSIGRGRPAEVPLGGTILCWRRAVTEMRVGGKIRLYCPASLAYRDKGYPPLVKPGAALVFEIELVEIVP